jgi:hypothetical protein
MFVFEVEIKIPVRQAATSPLTMQCLPLKCCSLPECLENASFCRFLARGRDKSAGKPSFDEVKGGHSL